MNARMRETDADETNVWPAVTDTILLLASVFIVLAVSSMIFYAASQSRASVHESGQGSSDEPPLLSKGYAISSEILFTSGQHGLLIPNTTRACVRSTLGLMAAAIPAMRGEALQRHGESFHMVVEVAGHTDDDPYLTCDDQLGMVDGNWLLSSQRASALVHLIEQVLHDDNALREAMGMPSIGMKVGPGQTIIRAVGYSSQVPHAVGAVSAASEPLRVREERQRHDRRVELLLHAEPIYALTSRPSL